MLYISPKIWFYIPTPNVEERIPTCIENVFQFNLRARPDGKQMNNSFSAKEPEQDME